MTGEYSKYKVDEFGTHTGEVSLNVRLIQALIIFVLLEDEFQYPSFIVTKVSSLRMIIPEGFGSSAYFRIKGMDSEP